MSKVLLDTSAYRQLAAGHAVLQQFLEEAEEIAMNPVIIGEILCGFARGSSADVNRQQLQNFLDQSHTTVYGMNAGTADKYAFIFGYLRRHGATVAANDLWIAATAMQHGLQIATCDRDFLRIPQVMTQYFQPA